MCFISTSYLQNMVWLYLDYAQVLFNLHDTFNLIIKVRCRLLDGVQCFLFVKSGWLCSMFF